jgi:hypothetical protein
MMKSLRCGFMALALFGGLGGASPRAESGESAGAAESPTFGEHIAPILFANCVSCHRPGEIAPMSFTSYEETRPWVKSIRKAVADRTMPPWKAVPGVGGPWANDPSLSQTEIDTIVRWAEQGAPAGDLAKVPPLPLSQDPNSWKYGEPDVVAVFEEISVPAESDGYWGPTVPVTIPEGAWLRGIEIIPSNPAVAHHIVIYAGDYETMGTTARRDAEGKSYRDGVLKPKGEGHAAAPDQGIAGNAMLGARGAGGSNASMAKEGFGRPLPKNVNKLTGEFHFYNASDKEAKCRVKVGLHFGEGELQKVVHLHAPANFNIYIEPGKEGVESWGYHVFDQDVYLTSMTPHFHILGRDMTYFAVYPDGRRETLLETRDLDFNWQTAYTLAEPKLLPKGTRVEFLGHWRDPGTSPDHPVKKPVIYGPAAFDEMAFVIINYYPAEGKEEKPPQWTRRVKEYLEWFPSPDHHEGTAKNGMLGVPAIMTVKEGGAPTLRVAMPALLGHGLLEIKFTEAKWNGRNFTATTPPGGFFGGTVTMEGVMADTGPEATAIAFTDLAADMGGITANPWTFKTKAAQQAERRAGSSGE